MGIHGFFKLVHDNAPQAVHRYPITHYHGQRVAIDAVLAIYEWCSVGRSRNIRNAAGKYINHLQGMFFRTLRMLEAGMIPVYIFDGPPPANKDAIIAARRAHKDRVRVPQPVYEECKRLLDHMGVPWLVAPSEAEAQAADMTRHGAASLVHTEDSDALVFGAAKIIRGMQVGKTVTVEEIDLSQVLAGLNLTHESFVDLCILMGCDYTTTVPGIGVKRALELIKAHGTIENIILSGVGVPADFDFVGARSAFALHKTTRVQPADWKMPTARDLANLAEYLIEAHGLDTKKVRNAIAKLQALV